MLQMWPWKMSLVLEGNNNSTFQLLQRYKLLCFPLLKYTAKETLNVIELVVLLYLNLGFLPSSIFTVLLWFQHSKGGICNKMSVIVIEV